MKIPLPPWVEFKSEVGAAEILAFLTALSFATAALFNFGFFLPLEWSFISLLSISDLFVGTIVAVPATIAALGFCLIISDDIMKTTTPEFNIRMTANLSIKYAVAFVICLLMYASTLAFPITGISYYAVLSGYMAVGILFLFVSCILKRSKIWILWLGTAFPALPIILGAATVYEQAGPRIKMDSSITTKDSVVVGTVIRVTSNYLFVKEPGSVRVIPLSEVASIVRQDR